MRYLHFGKKRLHYLTILIIIVFFILPPKTNAQFNDTLKNGILTKSSDFITGRIFPDTGTAKIKNNFLFNNQYIEVITETQKFRFRKDSIYGYVKNNQVYRIYGENHQELIIADTGPIVIYKKETYDPYQKFSPPVYVFYFSLKADSEIYPLTIAYLKKMYEDNCDLCIHLETNFSDATLSVYDEIKKKYKINLFLKQFHN